MTPNSWIMYKWISKFACWHLWWISHDPRFWSPSESFSTRISIFLCDWKWNGLVVGCIRGASGWSLGNHASSSCTKWRMPYIILNIEVGASIKGKWWNREAKSQMEESPACHSISCVEKCPHVIYKLTQAPNFYSPSVQLFLELDGFIDNILVRNDNFFS